VEVFLHASTRGRERKKERKKERGKSMANVMRLKKYSFWTPLLQGLHRMMNMSSALRRMGKVLV
jgi:hypothetical protein